MDKVIEIKYPNNTLKYDYGHKADAPDLGHKMDIINDKQEVECYECCEIITVEGVRETDTYCEDRFNGSHYQNERSYEVFTSTFICPKCNALQEVEQEV